MKANDIYRNLTSEPSFWAKQTNRVRWYAARYYAGIDTIDQLLAAAQPTPISPSLVLPPALTEDIVREIIRSR